MLAAHLRCMRERRFREGGFYQKIGLVVRFQLEYRQFFLKKKKRHLPPVPWWKGMNLRLNADRFSTRNGSSLRGAAFENIERETVKTLTRIHLIPLSWN